MDAIESLRALGLTGTEARLYAVLSRHGPLTGYEAAMRAGVARANAYAALDRLVQRGAAQALAGERAPRFEAVPVAAFVEARVRQLRGAAGALEVALTPAAPNGQAATGRGWQAMDQAAHALVDGAARSLHLATGRAAAPRLGAVVREARTRVPKVVAACLSDCTTPCATCGPDARSLPALAPAGGLLLCADRRQVVAAESADDDAGFLVIRSDLLAGALAALIDAGAPVAGP